MLPAPPRPVNETSADALVPYGYAGPPIPASDLRPPTSRYLRYLTFLKKKWWFFLLTLPLFAGLAAAYILWWPMDYVSTAHMWVAGKSRLRESATYNDQNENYIGSQVELLQSKKLQTLALGHLQHVLHIAVPTNSHGTPAAVKLRVSDVRKSSVLELQARGPSKNYVRFFLNALMQEFISFKRETRAVTAGETYASVSEQINRREADLKTAQDKLTTYQRENNVAVLEEQAKAAGAYLTQLLTESSRLKLERQILEAMSTNGLLDSPISNLVAGLSEPEQPAAGGLSPASPAPEYVGAQQELEKLRITRARLSKSLRPEHPKIVRLDEEIARGEKVVEYYKRQNRDQLDKASQTLNVKMDSITGSIKDWEANVNNASQRIAEYDRLKVEVERQHAFVDRLLNLLQNVDLSRNLEQEQIDVLDEASPPKEGKLPPTAVMAVALVLGIGAGLGLIFLVERADDRVMSLRDLSGGFNEWIVGQVPEVPRARKMKKPALLELDDSRHLFAESYRNLRSALWYAPDDQEKPKTLLITSAMPSEGKSTVAANLARTMAAAGARVLLVDADLRRGLQHELFGVPAEPGLSDLLLDGGDLPFYLTTVSLTSASSPPTSGSGQGEGGAGSGSGSAPRPLTSGFLHLLPRGKIGHNPGALFLGPNCDRLLERVRKEYDCVILDSIPVFAADDTTSLAPKVDGVLFVFRSSFTSTGVARHALQLLYERQAKVLGLVFNRADSASPSYKYYKYGGYSHSAKTA